MSRITLDQANAIISAALAKGSSLMMRCVPWLSGFLKASSAP